MWTRTRVRWAWPGGSWVVPNNIKVVKKGERERQIEREKKRDRAQRNERERGRER